MAVTFTGAGTANAASGASPQAVTTATSFAVGDMLVALIAYDNSGGGGADPMTGTITVTPASGAVGASVSAQTGLNDPGTASSGLCARCVAFPVTTTIPTSTSCNVAWSGTVVVRAVAFMKVSTAGAAGYRTNSGATGANGVAVTTVAHTTPSTNVGEGLLCWATHENGAAITGDAVNTNGTWSAVYGTFNGSGATGMAAYFQSKVQTTTAATNSFDPTGTSSDWIVGSLIFTEVPGITLASYQFFAEGTESGSTALAARDTPAALDVSGTDVKFQLRVRLQNGSVAGAATDDYQLQYDKNSGGSWVTIGNATSGIFSYLSPSLTDNATTTNRLGAGTGSFSAGEVSSTTASTVSDYTMTANNYTEFLYSLSTTRSQVVNGDSFAFRVQINATTTGMTYAVSPTVTIIKAVPPVVPTMYPRIPA